MKRVSASAWHHKALFPVALTAGLTAAILVGGASFSASAGESGQTPTVTAAAAAASGASGLWGTGAPKGAKSDSDSDSVELGTQFTAKVDGTATGIRFWKNSENKGTHVGNLWSSSGKLLASAKFGNETAAGWQTVTLSAPVKMTAGSKYTVSYLAPKGRYAATQNHSFGSASPTHLTVAAKNSGVYAYGAKSSFPKSTWKSSNYWVDVQFAPTGKSAKPPVQPETPVTPTEPPVNPTSPPVAPPTPPVAPPATLPSSGEFGDASNTGPTAAGFNPTQRYTGPRTITTAGTVITNQIIPAGLIVEADDVTIQGNLISGPTYVPDDEAAIHVKGKRVRILDNEIRGDSAIDWRQTPASGLKLFGDDFTVERNNIHRIGGDAVTVVGQNASIVGNWIHDFTPRDGVHYDALVWGPESSGSPDVIRDNTIEMWIPGMMTSTVSIPANAPKMIVDHNVMAGGGYTLTGGGGGTSITNNLFWTKFSQNVGDYGPKAFMGSVNWSNNSYTSNGQTAGAILK